MRRYSCKNNAEIGLFKIVAETGITSGVRCIEAVARPAVLEYLNVHNHVLWVLSDRFKSKPKEICDCITGLQSEFKATQKQLDAVKFELAITKSDQLLTQTETVGDFKILVANLGE